MIKVDEIRIENYYTLEEASDLLDMSKKALYNKVIANEKIKREWFNNRIYLKGEEVKKIIEEKILK